MGKVYVFDHPLIQHKLTYIRNENTGTKDFRDLVDEVASLMAFEITRDLPLKEVEVKTPVQTATSKVISGKKLGIVPILRAGLGMVDGMLKLIPAAKVGHVGLYRDPETLKPVEYYVKLPSDVEEREFIVVDPMLATGGSAVEAINSLKKRGARNIRFMCLVATRHIKRMFLAPRFFRLFIASTAEPPVASIGSTTINSRSSTSEGSLT